MKEENGGRGAAKTPTPATRLRWVFRRNKGKFIISRYKRPERDPHRHRTIRDSGCRAAGRLIVSLGLINGNSCILICRQAASYPIRWRRVFRSLSDPAALHIQAFASPAVLFDSRCGLVCLCCLGVDRAHPHTGGKHPGRPDGDLAGPAGCIDLVFGPGVAVA